VWTLFFFLPYIPKKEKKKTLNDLEAFTVTRVLLWFLPYEVCLPLAVPLVFIFYFSFGQ
jgi:hypothetical protein